MIFPWKGIFASLLSLQMLCDLAYTFPPFVARLLERDSGLTRNFREETVTDLLVASMIGLESFGVRVDFPDEPATGGDIEWIYAAPLEIKGGRYLRLILQAKRAQFAQVKRGSYWYYSHLDHGAGAQAQTLVSQAASPGTLPLYIFYHPSSALEPASGTLPAVEGVNIVFANEIAPIVQGGCGRKSKRVSKWRPKFLPMSDLLCWPIFARPLPISGISTTAFLQDGSVVRLAAVQGAFHPDIVAERLQESSRRTATADAIAIAPADGIPDSIGRAIRGETSSDDRRRLERPRIVLSTSIRREDPEFRIAQEQSRMREQ